MGSRWYLLRPVRVPGGTPRCALIPRALVLSRKTTARCFGGSRRPSIRTTAWLRVPTVWGWAAEGGQEPPTLGSTPPVPRQLLTLVPYPAPAVLALLLSFGLLVGALLVHAAQGLPVLIAEWQTGALDDPFKFLTHPLPELRVLSFVACSPRTTTLAARPGPAADLVHIRSVRRGVAEARASTDVATCY